MRTSPIERFSLLLLTGFALWMLISCSSQAQPSNPPTPDETPRAPRPPNDDSGDRVAVTNMPGLEINQIPGLNVASLPKLALDTLDVNTSISELEITDLQTPSTENCTFRVQTGTLETWSESSPLPGIPVSTLLVYPSDRVLQSVITIVIYTCD